MLLAAWLLIGTGNWAFVIAIAVHAFNESGSGAVAVLIAARLVPALIAAPFIGHLVDRFQRDRVAASFCAAAAAGMGIAGALVLADAPLWAVGLAVALTGATVSAPRPALQTLIPALARTPQELTRATAAWSALDSLGFMLGSGLGGIAVGAFDPGSVLLAASVLLALAGLLSVTLPSTQAIALDEGPEQGEDSVWGGLLGGLRAMRDFPGLRVPAALLGGLLILEGSSDVQLVALAIGELDMGDAGPGVLYAVWGLGGLAASGVVLALLRRRGYGLAMGAGVMMLGLALAVAGTDGVVFALIFAAARSWVRSMSAGMENRNQSLRKLFHLPLICSAALLSFAHGSNDVANAVGPLAAIFNATESGVVMHQVGVPLWVMLIGAVGISLGLFLFGPRIIRIVGEQITKMNPMRAFCVALSAALTVLVASHLGMPVSTTHTAVGAVFGVGFFREYYTTNSRRRRAYIRVHRQNQSPQRSSQLTSDEALRRKLVRRSHFISIVAAWAVTVPSAAALSGLIYFGLEWIR